MQWAGVLPGVRRHRDRAPDHRAPGGAGDGHPGRRRSRAARRAEDLGRGEPAVDGRTRRQMGYETWRYFFRMRRDLAEPVPSTAELDGVQIRRYRSADDDAVLEVSNESFGDHWGSTPMDRERWRAEYADSPSFRPELSYLALVDGAVVSFVLTSEFESDTEHRGYSTGYIARVGSLRERPRPGHRQRVAQPHPASVAAGRLPVRRTGCGCRFADRRRPDLPAGRLRHHRPEFRRRQEF